MMLIEKNTPEKPEVAAIARDLGLDTDAAFGKLFRIWAWFDSHTNGHAPFVTSDFIDGLAGVPGFGQSMVAVGWLSEDPSGLTMPSFEKFCGAGKKPTKSRERQTKPREATKIELPPILNKERFRQILGAWLEYKGRAYKPRGLQYLISRARNLTEIHGLDRVCLAMERAMACGYSGWDHDGWFREQPRVSEPCLAGPLLDGVGDEHGI